MGSVEIGVTDIVTIPNKEDQQYVITRVEPGVSSMYLDDGEIVGFPGSMRGPIEHIGKIALEELHEGMVSALSLDNEDSAEMLERLKTQIEYGPVRYEW